MQDLRRRAQSEREFTHMVDQVEFQLRHPSKLDAERIWATHRTNMVSAMALLVRDSLIGWRGVRVRDAVPESKQGDEPLPFEPEAVDLVLNERTDWVKDIGDAIVSRMSARQKRIEADRKNSLTGSDSNAIERTHSSSTQSDSAH